MDGRLIMISFHCKYLTNQQSPNIDDRQNKGVCETSNVFGCGRNVQFRSPNDLGPDVLRPVCVLLGIL